MHLTTIGLHGVTRNRSVDVLIDYAKNASFVRLKKWWWNWVFRVTVYLLEMKLAPLPSPLTADGFTSTNKQGIPPITSTTSGGRPCHHGNESQFCTETDTRDFTTDGTNPPSKEADTVTINPNTTTHAIHEPLYRYSHPTKTVYPLLCY